MSNKGKCKELEKTGKINFKSSRSILDALKNLFKIPNLPSTNIIESNLLAFGGGNKPGLSADKIAARIISRKAEAGLPTGQLEGGAVAPDELMEKIRMEEIIKAITEDMRMDVCTRPGAQLEAKGANAGGPIQVLGTIISTSCGHGQAF